MVRHQQSGLLDSASPPIFTMLITSLVFISEVVDRQFGAQQPRQLVVTMSFAICGARMTWRFGWRFASRGISHRPWKTSPSRAALRRRYCPELRARKMSTASYRSAPGRFTASANRI